MRQLLLTFILVTASSFMVSSMARAQLKSNDPGSNETKFIWRNIPFMSGADLHAFKNTFAKTRTEARREMVDEATRLMEYGATGYEALMMIAEFDEMDRQHRSQAKQGMDITLEFMFKAALQDLFDKFAVPQKKINFLSGNSVDAILEAAQRARKLRRILPQDLPRLDFLAVGTFSPAADGKGSMYVGLELIDLKGNPSITFDATAESPMKAIRALAEKFFDYFQRTQFPATIRRADGSTLTILGTPSGNLNMQARCEDAVIDCQHMGGRLPHLKEIEEVHRWGRYNNGISIDPHNNYCLAKPGHVYVGSFDRYKEQPVSLLSAIYFHFFCVK